MAANTSPIFVATPKAAGVTFTSADTTTAKTILTAGSEGAKVLGLSAVSDDSAAINVRLFARISGTDYQIGTVRVAALSGTDGAVSAKELLDPTMLAWLDADYEFVLPASAELKAACLATMTAAKTLTLVGFYGDY